MPIIVNKLGLLVGIKGSVSSLMGVVVSPRFKTGTADAALVNDMYNYYVFMKGARPRIETANSNFAQGPDKKTIHAVSHVTVFHQNPSSKLS